MVDLEEKQKSIYSVMEIFLGLPVLKSTPCDSGRVTLY